MKLDLSFFYSERINSFNVHFIMSTSLLKRSFFLLSFNWILFRMRNAYYSVLEDMDILKTNKISYDKAVNWILLLLLINQYDFFNGYNLFAFLSPQKALKTVFSGFEIHLRCWAAAWIVWSLLTGVISLVELTQFRW